MQKLNTIYPLRTNTVYKRLYRPLHDGKKFFLFITEAWKVVIARAQVVTTGIDYLAANDSPKQV